VRKQVECGIEIVTDGEYSKPGFFTYIRERFDGFESRPNQKLVLFQKEVSSFPEYYAQYFKEDGWRHPADRSGRLHRAGEI
jgi:5-methyltetrahydropteroyltriglutamate--homocysteine methyltransferase